MIQLLLTMIIVSIFFSLMLKMTQILLSFKQFPDEIQDQIGLMQLRRFMNGCPVAEIYDTEIICVNEKQWHLRCSANHLFLSPGTIIVLSDVNEVYFDQRGAELWMIYLRKNEWKEALITHV